MLKILVFFDSRYPRPHLLLYVFKSKKSLVCKTLFVLEQKKGAFLIPDFTMTLKPKGTFLSVFSIFWKFVIFPKIKGTFFLNWASVLCGFVKGAFLSERIQFSLEKISSVVVFDIFLQKFHVAHKIDFFSWLLKHLKISQIGHFLSIFTKA